MDILIDKSARLLVQGVTDRDGLFHAKKVAEYETNVAGGTSPGKGRTVTDDTFPVFNTTYETIRQTQVSTFVIFVPARFTADTIIEATDAGIQLIIYITGGVPTLDTIKAYRFAELGGAKLIGPNCPGLISPGKSLVGVLPGQVFTPSSVGAISHSGTLTYKIVSHLTARDMGQSTAIGMGGDPIVGLYFRDPLGILQNDPQTDAIVMIGEIGGNAEGAAATYTHKHVTKPVMVFIAGKSAPPGKQMGRIGAIISGSSGSTAEKISALEAAGIRIAGEPSKIPDLLKDSF